MILNLNKYLIVKKLYLLNNIECIDYFGVIDSFLNYNKNSKLLKFCLIVTFFQQLLGRKQENL